MSRRFIEYYVSLCYKAVCLRVYVCVCVCVRPWTHVMSLFIYRDLTKCQGQTCAYIKNLFVQNTHVIAHCEGLLKAYKYHKTNK